MISRCPPSFVVPSHVQVFGFSALLRAQTCMLLLVIPTHSTFLVLSSNLRCLRFKILNSLLFFCIRQLRLLMPLCLFLLVLFLFSRLSSLHDHKILLNLIFDYQRNLGMMLHWLVEHMTSKRQQHPLLRNYCLLPRRLPLFAMVSALGMKKVEFRFVGLDLKIHFSFNFISCFRGFSTSA